MNAKSLSAHCCAMLCAIFCFNGAQAHELGQHPAVLIQKMQAGIDANTFIVGHPAGLALHSGHANQAHPAVAMAAQAKLPIDTNTFIVQPPAAVTWTLSPVTSSATHMAELASIR